ncbi:hypothetical protein ACHAXR_012443 [Thalassiosira sp. AJA248-18]
MNSFDITFPSRETVSPDDSSRNTGTWALQQENMTAPATSTSMLDTMQWISSTEGNEGLRSFLNRLSTQDIEALLVASEMRAMPRRPQEYDRATNLVPSMSDYPGMSLSEKLHPTMISNSIPQAAPGPASSSFAPSNFETRQISERHIAAASPEQLKEEPSFDQTISLFIESDRAFLDPVHNFLRCSCIEVFVSSQNDMTAPGRGARPSKVGQVGLRCVFCKDMPRQHLARQAVCFPSKLETIFESVRNYQRTHFGACPHIPKEIKAHYKSLIEQDSPRKKPQKVLRAYYAEAANELGLVDTPYGLAFGASPNKSGVLSERMQAIICAAESPNQFASLLKTHSSGTMDQALEMRKFGHVASDSTRTVIINARKDPSPFVRPQDFPTISDIDFLLFHQVSPCRPTAARLQQRRLDAKTFTMLPGLCCKHCALANAQRVNHHRGMYFPTDLESLTDSSFSQTLLNHLMSCPNVPDEVKNAFDELKQLALSYGIATKRGSKKKFFEKIWARMRSYYE